MKTRGEAKRVVFVLAAEKKSCDFLCAELEHNIGTYAEIAGLHFQDDLQLLNPPDLIVTAGKRSFERGKQSFPNTPVVIAKRNLSLKNVEELCLLPKGKTVLVVNYSKEPTMKTIASLENMGLDHLKYVPYWKNCEVKTEDYDTVISPGMLDICPAHITRRIDIGMRDIALSTYINVFLRLGLDLETIDMFTSHYNKLLINTYKRLNREKQRAEATKINMQDVLNELDSGSITIDKNFTISAINHQFKKDTGLSQEELAGKSVESLKHKLPGLESMLEPGFINKKKYIDLKGKAYLGSCIPIMKESGENYVLLLKNAEELVDPERKHHQKAVSGNDGISADWDFSNIVADCDVMDSLVKKAKLIARTNSTVLITGESGTGKELVAHSIHNESERSKRPFIVSNFAAIPEGLVDSELFGYEEGTFTGSKKGGYAGLFEQANGGTIFLDEIGDASLDVQKRLLRVLQNKEVMRLGSAKRTIVDVRIIAATNRNLKTLIEKGLFREDLYFRLKVCTLSMPSLRERKEDIPKLVRMFMGKYHIKHKEINPAIMPLLLRYDWPGNVRELENTIEYIASLAQQSSIEIEDLPEEIRKVSRKNDYVDHMTLAGNNIMNLYNRSGILSILKILDEHKEKNCIIGRRKLSDLVCSTGTRLTESQIRTRLKTMEKEKLLIIGKTKQGILITEKGKHILAQEKAL